MSMDSDCFVGTSGENYRFWAVSHPGLRVDARAGRGRSPRGAGGAAEAPGGHAGDLPGPVLRSRSAKSAERSDECGSFVLSWPESSWRGDVGFHTPLTPITIQDAQNTAPKCSSKNILIAAVLLLSPPAGDEHGALTRIIAAKDEEATEMEWEMGQLQEELVTMRSNFQALLQRKEDELEALRDETVVHHGAKHEVTEELVVARFVDSIGFAAKFVWQDRLSQSVMSSHASGADFCATASGREGPRDEGRAHRGALRARARPAGEARARAARSARDAARGARDAPAEDQGPGSRGRGSQIAQIVSARTQTWPNALGDVFNDPDRLAASCFRFPARSGEGELQEKKHRRGAVQEDPRESTPPRCTTSRPAWTCCGRSSSR